MHSDTATTLRRVARGLRYRVVPALIGKDVLIEAANHVVTRVSEAAQPHAGAPLVHIETSPIPATIAKYGLLDLSYRLPQSTLRDIEPGGLDLLQELGFLQPGEEASEESCLDVLDEEIRAGDAYIKVFLATEVPDHESWWREYQSGLPSTFWPRRFKVVDACRTNTDAVWLLKHFYF